MCFFGLEADGQHLAWSPNPSWVLNLFPWPFDLSPVVYVCELQLSVLAAGLVPPALSQGESQRASGAFRPARQELAGRSLAACPEGGGGAQAPGVGEPRRGMFVPRCPRRVTLTETPANSLLWQFVLQRGIKGACRIMPME